MRNANYRTLFSSKYAEKPSFTFELLFLSVIIFLLFFIGVTGFHLPKSFQWFIWKIYSCHHFVILIPIILIYLTIQSDYNNPVLLEIALIIFIIQLSFIAYLDIMGYANTPRPLVNKFLLINVIMLHVLVWAAFFIQNKLILNICMAIMIGIALFDMQYSMVMSGLFHGYPLRMVEFWEELCGGSHARHWNIHLTVKNLAICTSIGMLITLLDILYKQINKLIKSLLS